MYEQVRAALLSGPPASEVAPDRQRLSQALFALVAVNVADGRGRQRPHVGADVIFPRRDETNFCGASIRFSRHRGSLCAGAPAPVLTGIGPVFSGPIPVLSFPGLVDAGPDWADQRTYIRARTRNFRPRGGGRVTENA